MAITSQIIEERDGRTLALVALTAEGDDQVGPRRLTDPHDVYELSCWTCGASIAQLDHENDTRAAWDDPCPTEGCCGCDPKGTHHCADAAEAP